MYDELITRLREKAGAFDYDGRPDIACDYEQAADAIEELQQIAAHYEETAKDYFKDVCYYLERLRDAEETVVHCNNEENARIIATLLNMDADGHYLTYSSIFGEDEEPAPPKE